MGKRWTFDTTEAIIARAVQSDFLMGAAILGSGKTSDPGLIDALLEVGRRRQAILGKLRSAIENKDLDAVLRHAGELVGLDDKVKEDSNEESH